MVKFHISFEHVQHSGIKVEELGFLVAIPDWPAEAFVSQLACPIMRVLAHNDVEKRPTDTHTHSHSSSLDLSPPLYI